MPRPPKPAFPDNPDLEIGTYTLYITRRLHYLMKELASRKRMFLSALYDEAIEEYLNKPEHYMGENFRVPQVTEMHKSENCNHHIAGHRCRLPHGHEGKHQTLARNEDA